MNCKLIAIDADGTLLGKNYIIPDGNKDAIRRASEKGVKVVLCSGRSYSSLKYFARELELHNAGNYIISFNGGTIHELGSESILRDVKMPKSLMDDILAFAEGFAVEPIIYRQIDEICIANKTEYTSMYAATSKAGVTYVESFARDIEGDIYKVLFLGENGTLTALQDKIRRMCRTDFNMFLSAQILLEFTPPEVTKGTGLKYLCGVLGIDIKDTIAIGDSYNDISMLEAAGLGVAMLNADSEVKAHADYVTERSNIDCGVAEIINKFIS